jgi:NSS family neurotransmitter:Na+ symporter
MSSSVHQTWSSRGAFLLATAGAAVGLGNVWRFPFVTGQNGGAAFVLVYLACVFLIGVPIIMAELAMGRMAQLSPIGTINALVSKEHAGPIWRAIGFLSLAVPFMGFSYYSVVAGWSLYYTADAMLGAFQAMSTAESQTLFGGLVAAPLTNVLLQGAVLMATAAIVGGGLRGGIERATKIMMPGLLLILLIMIGYNLVAADIGQAFTFLFAPDFSRLTMTSILIALGQAFFSVGVGVGFMITYGAYLPKDVSIPRAAVTVASVDTLVALLAGLAIFPIVFSSGLDPSEGPGLVFMTMPVAFGVMPLGYLLGILFFLLLVLAAFTTTIGMLEPMVSYLEERWRSSRIVMSCAAALVVWMSGVFPALSDNVLAGVRPVSFIPALADKSVFEVYDFLTASVLIPINALLIALFAGWIVTRSAFEQELAMDRDKAFSFSLWHILIRYVVPFAVLVITVTGLMG